MRPRHVQVEAGEVRSRHVQVRSRQVRQVGTGHRHVGSRHVQVGVAPRCPLGGVAGTAPFPGEHHQAEPPPRPAVESAPRPR